MKIQGPGYVQRVNPYSKTVSKDDHSTKKSEQKDQISISNEAKFLLDEVSGQLDVERKQKVDQLKQQIESGTYKVEADQVADKLLEWWSK